MACRIVADYWSFYQQNVCSTPSGGFTYCQPIVSLRSCFSDQGTFLHWTCSNRFCFCLQHWHSRLLLLLDDSADAEASGCQLVCSRQKKHTVQRKFSAALVNIQPPKLTDCVHSSLAAESVQLLHATTHYIFDSPLFPFAASDNWPVHLRCCCNHLTTIRPCVCTFDFTFTVLLLLFLTNHSQDLFTKICSNFRLVHTLIQSFVAVAQCQSTNKCSTLQIN